MSAEEIDKTGDPDTGTPVSDTTVLTSDATARSVTKSLSNPFSTGAGGPSFENKVQTLFVIIMLTGGHAPCLPPWPIVKILLQGRHAGYNTDDFIVIVQEPMGSRTAKLLAQIKRSVKITEGDPTFGEVITAAWADFNDGTVFDPDPTNLFRMNQNVSPK